MIRQWGGDVVGMTNVPEAQLAKELGLCYAAVSVVVNMATGMEKGSVDLEYGDGTIQKAMQRLRNLLKDTLLQPLDQEKCGCSDALIPL
jgi:5'-methylthioadenosine phosphorylase